MVLLVATGRCRGYRLPAKHVIHTVGPIYRNDAVSEPLLTAAYTSSMELANQHGLKTIAFPAISCGVFGYPKDKAATVRMRSLVCIAGLQPVGCLGRFSDLVHAACLESHSLPLQVSLRAVAAAVGSVEEVHFILFGNDMLEAYVTAAKKLFGDHAEL
eukprot:362018-Chlamydomonas_euryale.AAC.5